MLRPRMARLASAPMAPAWSHRWRQNKGILTENPPFPENPSQCWADPSHRWGRRRRCWRRKRPPDPGRGSPPWKGRAGPGPGTGALPPICSCPWRKNTGSYDTSANNDFSASLSQIIPSHCTPWQPCFPSFVPSRFAFSLFTPSQILCCIFRRNLLHTNFSTNIA